MGAARDQISNLPNGYTDVVELFQKELSEQIRLTKEQIKSSGYVPLRILDDVLYVGRLGSGDLGALDSLKARIAASARSNQLKRTVEITLIPGDMEVILNRLSPGQGNAVAGFGQMSGPDRAAMGLLSGTNSPVSAATQNDDELLEMRDIDSSQVWDLDSKNPAGRRVIKDKNGGSKELEPARDLLYRTLATAVENKATDIHIEATESKLRVRYRIDGLLEEAIQVPGHMRNSFIAAVKVNSTIDSGSPMGFESGRAAIRTGGRVYDLRIEKDPSAKGQELVIRILDKQADWRLDTLHFSHANLQKLQQVLRTPYGLVLITGPTGSGKSTTLFAMLSELARPGDKKILTIENPVEYEIKGANQVNVSEKQKQTFAGALRSFLRQDPDIIMVGETRDKEVATIAAQAAETGHLVFTTLHTNDSAGAFPRLTGMELKIDLMLSSIEVVLAQRLVRKVNNVAWEFQDGLASEIIGPLWTQSGMEDGVVRVAVQPRDFRQEPLPSGFGEPPALYKGRMPVHEVLMATPDIKEMVKKGAIQQEIKAKSRQQGMYTMFQDGLLKVGQGLISMESLLGQLKPDDGYVLEDKGMGLGRWSLEKF